MFYQPLWSFRQTYARYGAYSRGWNALNLVIYARKCCDDDVADVFVWLVGSLVTRMYCGKTAVRIDLPLYAEVDFGQFTLC